MSVVARSRAHLSHVLYIFLSPVRIEITYHRYHSAYAQTLQMDRPTHHHFPFPIMYTLVSLPLLQNFTVKETSKTVSVALYQCRSQISYLTLFIFN